MNNCFSICFPFPYVKVILLTLFVFSQVFSSGCNPYQRQKYEEAQPELEKKIIELIEQLGVDSWYTREQATQKLIEIGWPSQKYLKKALHHQDAEIRLRAKIILSQIGDLVAHYKFDEGSGTTANDSSNYGNNGAVFGATWSRGALTFDGVDDYVEIPHNPILNNANLSIEAWIYLNADVGNAQTRIVSKQETGGRCYSLGIFGNGYYGSTGNQIYLNIGNGSTTINLLSTTKLSIGRWYYVAGTHAGTTSKIYIDGVLDKEGTTTAQTADNLATLTIGCLYQTDTPNWGHCLLFNGLIDEVKIYTYARTADEINKTYKAGR